MIGFIASFFILVCFAPFAAAELDCGTQFQLLHTSPETKAAQEKYFEEGRWQEAAWQLLEAGDHATYEALEKRIQDALLHAPIQGEMKLVESGSSEVFKVQLPGNVHAIFKPSPKFWRWKRIRPFHDDRAAEKEAAAYAFDRAVGGHIVPVTVKRTIDGKEGSLQIFIHLDEKTSSNPGLAASQIRTGKRLAVLDYMMGTHDRTPMNAPPLHGAPVGIDNAMTFLKKSPHYSFGIQQPPRQEEIAKVHEYGEAILSYRNMDLTKARRALAAHLEPDEVEAAMQRVEEIKRLADAIARSNP